MAQSTDQEDARILLDISFRMNNVINDQYTLKLVDICFDDTLQIICKSFLYFAKILKVDNFQKWQKF